MKPMSENAFEFIRVLDSISKHTSYETRNRYRNLSIGRGVIKISGVSQTKEVWIVNRDYERTSLIIRDVTGAARGAEYSAINEVYEEPGSVVISKNREYAKVLLRKFSGPDSIVLRDGRRIHFTVFNSASYLNDSGNIINLRVGVSGLMNAWVVFNSLAEARRGIKAKEEELAAKRKKEDEAKRKAEELLLKQKEEAERLAKEESERLAEEARKAEEEARKAEEARIAVEQERLQLIDKYQQARAFIRTQVSLRKNPVLDDFQDEAKFSNLFNRKTVIINGGPGTGKTTTMIQRLKLMIDRLDLEDYIRNHNDLVLSDEQFSVITSSNNWIYSSPNELLKKYLQGNMDYEGLTEYQAKTAVWSTFLQNCVRDYYHLAGQEAPFSFVGKKMQGHKPFIGDEFRFIDSFSAYVLEQVKESFKKVSQIDCSGFEWRILGSIIIRECKGVESVKSIRELIQFLLSIERVDRNVIINNRRQKSGKELADDYTQSIQDLADAYISVIRQDDDKNEAVLQFIKNLERRTDEEGEDEEFEQEQDYGDIVLQLGKRLRSLLRVLSLRTMDTSAKLVGNNAKLYELVKDFIREEDLKKLGDSAYFVKHIYPVLKSLDRMLFSRIPALYKSFRRVQFNENLDDWDIDCVDYIDSNKNKPLFHQEQDLLVGFLSRMSLDLYSISKNRFLNSPHRFVVAYRENCRPVIGVDEATDYSILDYYAIKSFGHYLVSGFTLCGDTMQLMKEDGITDWEILRHPLLFGDLSIKSLNISYRQTKELMDLAGRIYYEETGKESPYVCFQKEAKTPRPLWLESSDEKEKAKWIVDRVLDIDKAYDNVLPTIAIFTENVEAADKLKELLDDEIDLDNAGISVRVCSGTNLEGAKTLRIFPIDQVKGMEFEAVFFHNIDEIESACLINKYLYVGLSLASIYLAVTSSGKSSHISKMLRKYFSTEDYW